MSLLNVLQALAPQAQSAKGLCMDPRSCTHVLEPHAPSGVRRHRSPRNPRHLSGKCGALRLSLGERLWGDVSGVMC